jgi:phasin
VDEVEHAFPSRAHSNAIWLFGLPNFFGSKPDFPEFREAAEKSVIWSQNGLAKIKDATKEMGSVFRDAYEVASKGAFDYGVQLIEAGRTNVDAAFDYATKVLSVKSQSELIELSTTHLEKRVEVIAQRSQKLAALAQKVASETAKPLTKGLNRTFTQTA